jgi:hypothetical protein
MPDCGRLYWSYVVEAADAHAGAHADAHAGAGADADQPA